MPDFEIVSKMTPRGDQPQAIDKLTQRVQAGERYSTLLGVTGSGKTFTMAQVIARVKKPTLIITHNKTLSAQLYAEFRDFLPKNAVHYFVSYYDYYQPEAYIPQRDIYIEKDSDINEDIDRLRLAATSALLSRRDVVVVASVSCIYGLGSPEDYRSMIVPLHKGMTLDRHTLARKLVDIQYERSDGDSARGKFRVRGDTVEIRPAYMESAIRVEFDGDHVANVSEVHAISGITLLTYDNFVIYPAKHFVMPEDKVNQALYTIEMELEERLKVLTDTGKLLEAQRLKARTKYDLELLREIGHCKGIENYSRHLSGRKPGEPPATLLDYFPKDFLCIVDESHATIPQIHGMFNGDQARKRTLVDYGFRLPSALDNRPLRFEEWEQRVPQAVFVSATPAPYELKASRGDVVEQVIRPTGLVDPEIEVRPARGQVPDLIKEIKIRAEKKERVLVTTLTKRLAEDLANFLEEEGVKGKYLHSEIQTFERVDILRELREGKFDCLVGVNLLREGLDLPEVTLVAILDADKEGFLRSDTSIIQTVGRTARNVNGHVILYADRITDSMKRAMGETDRRRKTQLEYNATNGITPTTIEKEIRRGIEDIIRSRKTAASAVGLSDKEFNRTEAVAEIEKEMYAAAEKLEFERAAQLRDTLRQLTGDPAPSTEAPKKPGRRPDLKITYKVSDKKHGMPKGFNQ
ncbi:MAG TPA: excinuclease ABC subunit UvrB [Planctomycetota bacterium]|nr:excinuclease ABC subunit UvrB [Planctomycetota bacterium]